MSVKYRMDKCPDNLSTSSRKGLFPRIIRKFNINTAKLASRLSNGSFIRKGELKCTIEQVKEQIIMELLDGNSVSIDGLGSFSLSAGATRSVDKPEDIRAASIHVKSVNFKPSPDLMLRMRGASFTREE